LSPSFLFAHQAAFCASLKTASLRKTFLAEHGFSVPNFLPVRSREDLSLAVLKIGCPAVLKAATGGYDGKGQVRIEHPDEAEKAWERLGKGEPNWAKALKLPEVKLHLYGKAEPRPGRKMGHLTATAETPDEALRKVLEARRRLKEQA